MKNALQLVCFLVAALLVGAVNSAEATENKSQWVYRGVTGRLLYVPDAEGDRVPDFSDVGYRGGRSAIPTVPTAVTLLPVAGDNTASIQAAIDQVSALPLGPDGFRGAVELGAGNFDVIGQLVISTSGVVLRGSGRDAGGTVLRATGTSQRDLIQVLGTGSQALFGSTRNMIEETVPVGSRSFRVDSTAGFSVGDTVRVTRPSPANWISDIGMDSIPPRPDGQPITQWQPGSFDVRSDRIITRIEGDRVFVDAPLTSSFEQQYGGGQIKKYNWTGRIENVGIENLRAESSFASPEDEDHSWNFVSIDRAQNVWVRDTRSLYFADSAILSNPRSKWVTIDNVINEEPVSQIAGTRRYTFEMSGQLGLVSNSEANDGRHDFVNNSSRPAGPNVFYNSVANNPLDESGPHQRWATGTLFDNITVLGDQINAYNRGYFGTGQGWAGANMVIWNSTADSFIVQNPPTAQNWLIGSTGSLIDDQRFGPQPPGYVDSLNEPVDVDSLYVAQLEDAADVTTFQWSGGVALWGDPEAWDEQLSPGIYRVETREYVVGDIDDYDADGPGSADDAFVDPAWETAITGSSALPITGFDDSSGNANVAFTIQSTLDAGERVINGSLALSLKQAGGSVADDFIRLFNQDAQNRTFLSDIGWDTQINSSEAFVGLLDLGNSLSELQSGSVNVQISDNTNVDWALYTITVAKPVASPTIAPSVIIDGGGTVILANNVGSVASLSLGATSAGTLFLSQSGSLTVIDEYTQTADGSLIMVIGSSSSSLLSIDGEATLDGEIEVQLASGFAPSWGDSFEILSVEGLISGEFATVLLPGLSDGLVLRLAYTNDSVLVEVRLGGDFNNDGIVDASDYTVWRDALGSTENLLADGNGNGVVDQADYVVWASAFGATASSNSSGVSTPEPSAIVMLSIFLLLVMLPRNDAPRNDAPQNDCAKPITMMP